MALVVGGSTVVASEPANAAQPSSVCASMNVFIGVRGTGAPAGNTPTPTGRAWQVGGMGDQVGPIAAHFKNDYPFNSDFPTYVESLNYPAASEQIDSTFKGVSTLVAEMNYIGTACGSRVPNILLAGHSQGAAVISGALRSTSLNSRAKAAVKAAVLYGDPSHANYMPYSVNGNNGNGIFAQSQAQYTYIAENYRFWGWAPGSQDPNPGWVYRVRDYCFTGDAACTSNLNDNGWSIHNLYAGMASQATSWMDAMVTDYN